MKYLVFIGLVLSFVALVFTTTLYVRSIPPPAAGLSMPVKFPFSLSDIGPELVKNGTIDPKKFQSAYLAIQNGPLEITDTNANELLDVLWGFGLANKNDVLDKGPIRDPHYKIANFASTGGWTLGIGPVMDHYSHHQMIMLTPEQQNQVNDVAKTIYRPCCQNSAYFPDCNHGMAMLGLLELMSAHGLNEQQMKAYADQVNAKWFPPVQNSSCAT